MSTSVDHVRRRMAAVNPAPVGVEPPGDVMTADALLAVIDDRSGDMAQRLDTPEQDTPVTARRIRRNWAAAFAAGFAFVLIVGLAFGLLIRGGDPFDVVESVATSSPTPAPVNDVVWEWSMVDLDPAAMGRCAELHRVVWFRSHWVAVGIVAPDEFSGTCDDIEHGRAVGKAATWVSSDGLVWERVAVLDAWYPMGVTAGGPGLVAVGGALDEQLDPPRPYPVVWLSADGEDWWPVDDPVRDGSVGRMFGVAARTDGLVAVGYDCADPADRDCWAGLGFWNSRPAIWTSADGTEWARVPDDSAVFQGDSRIHGVAATPLGWVAVGRHTITPPPKTWGRQCSFPSRSRLPGCQRMGSIGRCSTFRSNPTTTVCPIWPVGWRLSEVRW